MAKKTLAKTKKTKPLVKKTWVEQQDFVLDDEANLIQYLIFAVWKNCKRLGWDMAYERRSESFYRVWVWLPVEKGWGNTNIYFDTETPGNLIKFEHSSGSYETEVFIKSFAIETRKILDEWARRKGELEGQRVNYLLTGKREKPTALVNGKQGGEQSKQQSAKPSYEFVPPPTDEGRKIYKNYNPKTAKTIADAMPQAWKEYNANGGKWGPKYIGEKAAINAVTVGRYLKVFRVCKLKTINGVPLPNQ